MSTVSTVDIFLAIILIIGYYIHSTMVKGEKIMRKALRLYSFIIVVMTVLSVFCSCTFLGREITLMTDSFYITPNGKDTPTFRCLDKNGNEIDLNEVSFYVNGIKKQPEKITAVNEGTLEVYAEYGDLISNTLTITAQYHSQLPIIVIQSESSRISENSAVPTDGIFYLFEPNSDGIALIDGGASLSINCAVNIRGQSSAGFDKKQYKVHLCDHNGNDANLSLLGMNSENDWVLNGSYADKTLLHNYLAFTLGESLNFGWTPDVKFVEVYITDNKEKITSRDYQGVYLLMESVKSGNNRISITKGDENTSEDKIGYIFAKDKSEKLNSSNTLKTDYDKYELVYPQPENASKEQKKYLTSKIEEFEKVLFSNNFADPETGYRQYFDVTSYIDYVLLSEYMKNVDGVRLSSYFTLDVDEKITYAAIWDWDLSCGIVNYGDEWFDYRWFYCLDKEKHGVDDYLWLDRLMEDEWFRSRLIDRYYELRENVLSDENVQSIINAAYTEIYDAAERNAARWPELYDGETYIWPNAYYFESFTEEVNYMKEFLYNRGKWLDKWMKTLA